MNELSQHAKEQLRLAKQSLSPHSSDRERVQGALLTALALGAASAAHTTTAHAGATSMGAPQVTSGIALAAQQGLLAKTALVIALASGVGGAVGYQVGYSRAAQQVTPETPAAQQSAPPVVVVTNDIAQAPIAIPVLPAPVAMPESPAQKSAPRAASTAMAQAAPADLAPMSTSPEAEEILQLERVQRALRDGYPALALAILGELDQKVPRGRLHEERSAARVIARCGMGEASPELSESFANRYPGSMYLERVAAACTAVKAKSLGSTTETGRAGQD